MPNSKFIALVAKVQRVVKWLTLYSSGHAPGYRAMPLNSNVRTRQYQMLPALKRAVSHKFEMLAELGGLALSLSGATLAVVLGKFLVAVVLGSLALGFVLRFKGRRAGRPSPPPAPGWVRPAAALLSVVEVAALVEATDLPVRFSQPGFATYHWALVVLIVMAAYLLQSQLLRSFSGRRSEKSAF